MTITAATWMTATVVAQVVIRNRCYQSSHTKGKKKLWKIELPSRFGLGTLIEAVTTKPSNPAGSYCPHHITINMIADCVSSDGLVLPGRSNSRSCSRGSSSRRRRASSSGSNSSRSSRSVAVVAAVVVAVAIP